MNPAFTLSFLALGKIAPWDAFFYVAFQFAGGLLGVVVSDFLIGIPSGVPNHEHQYEALRSRATAKDMDGRTVYVADLADIIASKEAANREKDREALPELRAIQAARLAKGAYARTLRMTLMSSLSTMRTGRSPLAINWACGSIPNCV